ncbi:MAG: hypothetical protein IT210_17725 [Armatimonadetes bacterium]|nr:hypothetical protein [Armatimonadota bacterium]
MSMKTRPETATGADEGAAEARPGITGRAALLGSLLIFANAYAIIKTEVIWASIHATILSLFFNVVGTIFALTLLNFAWKRRWPASALSQPELLVVYIMLSVATGLFGVDMLQIFIALIGHPFRFASESNGWAQSIFRQIPRWLTVSDPGALRGLYEGNASFFTPANLSAWAIPLLSWFAFTMALLWMCLCLNVLVRREWSEHERLSFPIIQLPMEMTHQTSGFFRSRLLWAGFAVAAFLNLCRAGHELIPTFPNLITKTDLGLYVATHPWNALGWMPVAFYPFAMGLGFLIPLDLSFSCWFFYLFWKIQVVARAAVGWEPLAGQYMGDQSSGAWVGIGALALWGSRRFVKSVFRNAFRKRSSLDDAREPLSYRAAILGFAGGMAGLTAFCLAGGMALWAVGVFWLLYFILMLAVMRMRAEMGAPAHDLYYGGPDRIMTATLGTGVLSPGTLTMFSLFYWITYSYRSHPIVHQMEGFKLSERRPISMRKLAGVMMLASAISFIAWTALSLGTCYHYGFSAKIHSYLVGASWESWNRLAAWAARADQPLVASWRQLGLGFGLTLGMMALRKSFLWFPLHPVGYAVSGSWTMSWLWFSMFLSWGIKYLVLKHGGLKTYRKALPLFFGAILGDYVVGGAQSLIGALFDVPIHGFFP